MTLCPVLSNGSILAKGKSNFCIMSEEKEIHDNEENVQNENMQEGTDEVKAEHVPTAEEKYAELHDKFIRLHAEFENFRRRTNKEKLDIIANANAGVLKDLIAILDDFERAINNNEKVDDIESVKEGFKLIYNKFKGILESKGLKEMKSVGESFDSELHEAIANVPAEDKKDVGKVIDAVEKGYYLNDTVIRYAKVVVGQ